MICPEGACKTFFCHLCSISPIVPLLTWAFVGCLYVSTQGLKCFFIVFYFQNYLNTYICSYLPKLVWIMNCLTKIRKSLYDSTLSFCTAVCKAGYQPYGSGCMRCPEGTYSTQGVPCKSCPLTQIVSKRQDACLVCPPAFSMRVDDSTCCKWGPKTTESTLE